jgi:Kef-type K+ transport system membrane component KefB
MATQGVLKGLEHHALFLLLLQLCLLLAVARTLGELMRRISQPSVVGELLAGVLLGPTVFGLAMPDLQAAVFPHVQSQSDLLSVVSWLGVLCLLLVTGLETDVDLILSKGRTALLISAGGIITPFAFGLGLGWLMPDEFLVNPDFRLVFALFMAVAMSISAVPVIAKVLLDLRLMRRDIGQLTLAAAMTDDTIGWILLSVVAGLAARGTVDLGSVGISIGTAVLFLAVSFTVGRRVVRALLTAIDDAQSGAVRHLSMVMVLALGAAAFTQEMGLEAVLGAFVIGILAGQSRRFKPEASKALETMTTSVLAPVFFATAGLKVDLVRLSDAAVIQVGLIVLAIACLGKFIGCYFGAWLGKLSHWERLALGAGMNARGGMGLIVATVGLGLGVLTREMYSVIVMVAIVTSLMAPPLLRYMLGKIEIGEAEAQRLESEAIAAASFVRAIRRVLLVAEGPAHARLAARMVGQLRQEQPIEVTAIYTNPEGGSASWWQVFVARSWPVRQSVREGLRAVRNELKGLRVLGRVKAAIGSNAAEQVLKEAAEGHDLIAIGVERSHHSDGLLFGRVADRVIQEAPCPTMVLRGPEHANDDKKIRKILAPAIGTEYSKNAVETASVFAVSSNAQLLLLNVVPEDDPSTSRSSRPPLRAKEIAVEIVEHQATIARKLGAEVEARVIDEARVIEAPSPEDAILNVVKSEGIDLIVLGTSRRSVPTRAFLGWRVENLLDGAPCTVAVISSL